MEREGGSGAANAAAGTQVVDSGPGFLVFRGKAEAGVEENGRMVIPSKFRGSLKNQALIMRFQLSKATEHKPAMRVIQLWPRPNFARMVDKMMQGHQLLSDNKEITVTPHFKQLLYNSVHETTLDSQNRLILPADLRTQAHIGSKAIVTGSVESLEIWDPETYETFSQEVLSDWNDIFETYQGLEEMP